MQLGVQDQEKTDATSDDLMLFVFSKSLVTLTFWKLNFMPFPEYLSHGDWLNLFFTEPKIRNFEIL